jgi:hypothetical protein
LRKKQSSSKKEKEGEGEREEEVRRAPEGRGRVFRSGPGSPVSPRQRSRRSPPALCDHRCELILYRLDQRRPAISLFEIRFASHLAIQKVVNGVCLLDFFGVRLLTSFLL